MWVSSLSELRLAGCCSWWWLLRDEASLGRLVSPGLRPVTRMLLSGRRLSGDYPKVSIRQIIQIILDNLLLLQQENFLLTISRKICLQSLYVILVVQSQHHSILNDSNYSEHSLLLSTEHTYIY